MAMVRRRLTPLSLVVLVLLLIGITTGFLLIEGAFKTNDNIDELLAQVGDQDLCWTGEDYDIIDDCKLCSVLEKTLEAPAVCQITGYRQKVKCYFSGNAFCSCDILVWQEELHFWIFETVFAACGVLAGLSTALIHQKLNCPSAVKPRIDP